jgi:hypothetical protein
MVAWGRAAGDPLNGAPQILPWKDLPDLTAKIGRNTGYLIHAEEMLADNFALLVTRAANAPSPEVLARIREALRGMPQGDSATR